MSTGERERILKKKKRENRLRRMARDQGFRLIKSRVRDRGKPGYGRYILQPWKGDYIVFTPGPTGEPAATLDQIEEYLNPYPDI